MIVDSSAVIAILKREPDHIQLAEHLLAEESQMSVANWLESSMVASSHLAAENHAFDKLIRSAGIEIVPVTVEQGRLARVAHQRYGRGSGSRARLNYGDCFAYALAIESDQPLLFKGDDFTHTDVRPALT